MLIAARDIKDIQNLKKLLKAEFDVKDLGAARRIFRMKIQRSRSMRLLHLSQKSYILKVLERFRMTYAKPVSTPFASHFRLSAQMSLKTDEEKKYMQDIPFASAVGSLMYAMVCTRPDLAYVVSMVSRYMVNPGKQHWMAVKWILRYLHGTVDTCLTFGKSHSDIVGFGDSDYAGDLDKRRSTTGLVFTLGGCVIS